MRELIRSSAVDNTVARGEPSGGAPQKISSGDGRDDGLQKQVDDFLHHLSFIRGLSPHTTKNYRRDLALLAANTDAVATQITPQQLRRIIAAETKRGQHPASTARKLAAWRSFFDYLQKTGAANDNPARAVRAPKKPARLPKALTPDETAQLLTLPPTEDFIGARDCAMFELLYSSALRVGELVALDTVDLDLKNGMVEVRRGKGGRGRVVPVGQTAATALTKWLQKRQIFLGEKTVAALFVGKQKKRLGVRSVQKRLTLLAKKNCLHGRISPHVLRHSCASHFLQSSGNLRATQELLGHKDISATQIYTRLDFQNLAKTYDATHPRVRR